MGQKSIEEKITNFTYKWNETFSRVKDPREYSALSYLTSPDRSVIGVLWKAVYHDPCLVEGDLPNIHSDRFHYLDSNHQKFYFSDGKDLFVSSSHQCYKIKSSTGYILIRYDTETNKFSSFSDINTLYDSVDKAIAIAENEIQQITKGRKDFLDYFFSTLSSEGFALSEMTMVLEELAKIKAYCPSQNEIRAFQEQHTIK